MRIFLGNTAGKSAKKIKSPSVFGVRIRNLIIQFMSSFMNITLISFMIVLKERTTKKFSSEKVGWFFFSSYVLLLCRRIVAVLTVNHAEPRLHNALVDLDLDFDLDLLCSQYYTVDKSAFRGVPLWYKVSWYRGQGRCLRARAIFAFTLDLLLYIIFIYYCIYGNFQVWDDPTRCLKCANSGKFWTNQGTLRDPL